MSKFSLVPYSIQIRTSRTNKYVPLSQIPSANSNPDQPGRDLFEILNNYFSSVLTSVSNNIDLSVEADTPVEEIFGIDFVKQGKRHIAGRLKGGKIGPASELINTRTRQIDYNPTIEHANTYPYYFFIAVPLKTNKGIVILQKLKDFGIKDMFFDDFYRHFKSIFGSDYVLEMDPMVPRGLVKEYLKGRIVKLRLIKAGFPHDTFNVDPTAFPEDVLFNGEAEMLLRAGRKGTLPQSILDPLSNGIDKFLGDENEPIGSIITVKDFNFDNVKIEVKIGKKSRTINFSDTDKIRYSEDISNVEVDANGHPKYDKINEKALAFFEDLSEGSFGGKIDV